MHTALALSAAGKNWYLVNATPDVRFQIESYQPLHPGPGVRETRIRGVLLTDSELDHVLGLLVLREGTPLDVFASSAVLAALTEDFPIRRVLESYTAFRWVEVKTNQPFLLDQGRLEVNAFRLGGKQPRYAVRSKVEGDWGIGYRFTDIETEGVAVFAPGIETWSAELDAELSRADCAFVDGTFWTDDEIIRAGVGQSSARQMGHLSISGPEGSAKHLSLLPAKRKVYVHINNTNPVLNEASDERRFLAGIGIEVGRDGIELEV